MKEIKTNELIPGNLYYYGHIKQCIIKYIGRDRDSVKFSYVKGIIIYARYLDGTIGFWDNGSLIFHNYKPFTYGK